MFKISIKTIKYSIIIYIIFYSLWGLNYNRKGISYQLRLDAKEYNKDDLILMDSLLREKVNSYKNELTSGQQKTPAYTEIFNKAYECYDSSLADHPYFRYKARSVKPVLLGSLTAYLGFVGHYNPFTGEAQVNTDVPAFTLPFTTCHEIAHQLGYAKEYEANFAAYIAVQHTKDPYFLYSTYLDLYLYTNGELYRTDSTLSKRSRKELVPAVMGDLKEMRRYRNSHQTFLEPLSEKFYATFLKLNEQPAGIRSYNQVVLWLIAYYKKNGTI